MKLIEPSGSIIDIAQMRAHIKGIEPLGSKKNRN
jgi:hypothetical protein